MRKSKLNVQCARTFTAFVSRVKVIAREYEDERLKIFWFVRGLFLK